MRFLIDECLTPALVTAAHAAGHEAYHVAHIGLVSAKDWAVARHAVARDMIFVTNNGADFRALYARLRLHPGLVVVIPSVDRETQVLLFRALLIKLAEIGEPVNKVLEAHLHGEEIRLLVYSWPPDTPDRA